ncbi:MAG: recombinase family protein [Bacillota bacterium]
MKTVIYARESSGDTNKAPPIEEQIKRAKQYCLEKDYELIDIYADNGYSGGNRKRPEYNRLLREARGHKFKLVLVWNQDRIARDTEQFLYFNRNMKENHVQVFSLVANEYIDLEKLGDRVKFQSLAQADEIFRLVTSDKVKRAYEMKKRKSKDSEIDWGRPRKELDINKILALRASGAGYRAIAKEFNCSYQTIRRVVLQNTLQENKQNYEGNSQINEGLQNNPIK